jgi:tetratricopeptide (TPR) repeat protein
MRLKRFEAAIVAYNKSLEIHNDKDANTYINIATSHGAMGEYQKSIEYYLKAFALNPILLTITNINHEFGFTYVKMGEFEKAREVFEKMTNGPDNLKPSGYRSLALLAMYRGKISEAIDHLKESILINKTNGWGLSEFRDRLFLATAYKTKGIIPEFYEELNKVNELPKGEITEPWWYCIYGKFLIRDGKIKKTERILNELSVRINEGNRSDQAASDILKGEIEFAKENTTESLELIINGIKLLRNSYTLESIANFYYTTGDLDKAISSYKEILEIKDFYGLEAQEYWIKAHYYLGRLYEKKAEYEQAVKYYKEFLNIWKDGDKDLPDIIDTNARLLKLKEWEE